MKGVTKALLIGISRGILEIKQFNRQREAVVFTFFPFNLTLHFRLNLQ